MVDGLVGIVLTDKGAFAVVETEINDRAVVVKIDGIDKPVYDTLLKGFVLGALGPFLLGRSYQVSDESEKLVVRRNNAALDFKPDMLLFQVLR
ncbi:hypothetical protein FACS1894211_04150 [Clostridia bacterium]|nr:hypothetical protein FACS1894211_04150 [Clostridia bacterium]